jgi:hypothetical protein
MLVTEIVHVEPKKNYPNRNLEKKKEKKVRSEDDRKVTHRRARRARRRRSKRISTGTAGFKRKREAMRVSVVCTKLRRYVT